MDGGFEEQPPRWSKLLPQSEFIEAQFQGAVAYSVTLDSHVIDGELYTWFFSQNRWSDMLEKDPVGTVWAAGVVYRTTGFRVIDEGLLARINENEMASSTLSECYIT